MDRTTVVNHILPQEEGGDNELAHLTLTALYALYFNYLTKAKKPTNEAYSWVFRLINFIELSQIAEYLTYVFFFISCFLKSFLRKMYNPM